MVVSARRSDWRRTGEYVRRLRVTVMVSPWLVMVPEVSRNRRWNNHRCQQWTPADVDNRRCLPGQQCRSAGRLHSDLASGQRGRAARLAPLIPTRSRLSAVSAVLAELSRTGIKAAPCVRRGPAPRRALPWEARPAHTGPHEPHTMINSAHTASDSVKRVTVVHGGAFWAWPYQYAQPVGP